VTVVNCYLDVQSNNVWRDTYVYILKPHSPLMCRELHRVTKVSSSDGTDLTACCLTTFPATQHTKNALNLHFKVYYKQQKFLPGFRLAPRVDEFLALRGCYAALCW